MRYLHPLAGCPSIAARRQPLADASAAVFPGPLFLVASTPQPHGTPAPQDRAPPPPCLFVSLPACPLLSTCLPPFRRCRPCLGGSGWGLRVGLGFLVMEGGARRWIRRRAQWRG